MTINVVTPPDANEPAITIETLKTHLSMLPTDTDFDTLIKMYLGSAVEEFTSRTKMAIISQGVRQTFDCFPDDERYFRLERAPLVSLQTIQYRNNLSEWATLPGSVYSYDLEEPYPIIQLKDNQTWPSDIHSSMLNCVRVNYEVGYPSQKEVPDDIKRILCMLIGDSYLYREDTVALPGVTAVVVTSSSYNAMNKFKINYYEHRSQSRR